jgi:hypothetical protein
MPRVFAQRVKPSDDPAGQVSSGERRRHRHRTKRRRPVVEVPRGGCARQDLKSTLRWIDHDDDRAGATCSEGT